MFSKNLSLTLLCISIFFSTQSQNKFCFSSYSDNALRTGGAVQAQFVTTGDFNADTWPDVVVANWGSNNITIYLNQGNGSFLVGTNYGVNANPRSITVADFNNDNKQDLAVACWNSNNLSLLLGNGNGTFAAATNVVVSSNATAVNLNSIVAIQYNGDTFVDLAVIGYTSNTLYLLSGNGNGTFANPITKPTGTNPRQIVKGRFNADLVDDLAVANQGSDNVSVYTSSNNNFNQGAYPVGDQPFSLVAMHIDNDSWMDLVVANRQAGTFSFLTRTNATGNFTQSSLLSDPGINPQFIQAAELDGNANNGLELAYVTGTSNLVKLIQRQSNGSFSINQNDLGSNYFGTNTQSLAFEDFNKDGKQDYAVASYDNSLVTIVIGKNTLEIPVDKNYNFNVGALQLAVGDINNDGQKELVTINNLSPEFAVNRFNQQTKNWEMIVISPGLANGIVFNDIKLADMNNDGVLDIVCSSNSNNTIYVSILNPDLGIANTVSKTISGEPKKLVVADFNGDGNNDVATCNGAASISIHLGNGNGDITGGTIFQIGVGTLATPVDIITADVNNDGKPDLVTANKDSDKITIFVNIPGGFTQNSFVVGTSPVSVAAAELNGDGKIDFVIGSIGDNTIKVRYGDGVGGVTANITTYNNITSPRSLVLSDFNDDGKVDIAWANINGGFMLGEGLGNGQFLLYASLFGPKFNVNFNSILPTDWNNDGLIDIAGVSTGGSLAGISLNQTAKITNVSPVLACAGSQIQLNAVQNSFRYSWSNGQSTSSISVNASGNYQLTTSNISNSCSSVSAPVTVTFTAAPAAPTATITHQTVANGTGSITLSGNSIPGLIYSFDNGQNYVGNSTKNGLAPGTYTTKVKDPNGCESPATTAIVKAFQSISLSNLSSTYGVAPYSTSTFNGSTTTGLPLTYTSSDPSKVSINNNTVTILAAGTVQITATQAGDTYTLAAQSVTRDFVVSPRQLNIIVNANQSKVYGTNDPVFTYTFNPPLVNGDQLTGVLTRQTGENVNTYNILQGTLTAGNNYNINYTGAVFTITKANPVVAFTSANGGVYGSNVTLAVNKGGSSGNISYQVTNGTGSATLNGNVVSLTKAGQVTLTATVAADNNYNQAIATQNFTITKATPSISINFNEQITYGNTMDLGYSKGGSDAQSGFTITSVEGTGSGILISEGTNYSMKATLVGQVDVVFHVAEGTNHLPAQIGKTVTINPRSLNLTGLAIENKTYDGGTTATIVGTPVLNGLVDGDIVEINGDISATFQNKNAGNRSVELSDVSLNGINTSPNNYNLILPQLSGIILPKSITVTGLIANNKVYDGTTIATITGTPTLEGFISGDIVYTTGTGVANFSNANAGNQRTVSVTGFTLEGTDKDNYTLLPTELLANIEKQTQNFVFNDIPAKILSENSFTLNILTDKNLPVMFQAGDDKISINGNTIQLVKPGFTSLMAYQPGDENTNPTEEKLQSFCINPAKPDLNYEVQSNGSIVITTTPNLNYQWFLNDELQPEWATNSINITQQNGMIEVVAFVDNCYSEKSEQFDLTITSVEDMFGVKIKLYPNPTHDKLIVELPKRAKQMEVFSYDGKSIITIHDLQQGINYLDVNNIPNGLYIIKIRIDETILNRKFIKSN